MIPYNPLSQMAANNQYSLQEQRERNAQVMQGLGRLGGGLAGGLGQAASMSASMAAAMGYCPPQLNFKHEMRLDVAEYLLDWDK